RMEDRRSGLRVRGEPPVKLLHGGDLVDAVNVDGVGELPDREQHDGDGRTGNRRLPERRSRQAQPPDHQIEAEGEDDEEPREPTRDVTAALDLSELYDEAER